MGVALREVEAMLTDGESAGDAYLNPSGSTRPPYPNTMTHRHTLSLLLALVALGVASCATPNRFERAECQRLYDDCTDRCAAECEPPPSATLDPEGITAESTAGDCAQCVDRCRDQARRCDRSAP